MQRCARAPSRGCATFRDACMIQYRSSLAIKCGQSYQFSLHNLTFPHLEYEGIFSSNQKGQIFVIYF